MCPFLPLTPQVHVVYSPLYHSHSDNEWIVQYMTTMASIYPNSQALELYSYEDMIDMYTKGVVCFKNLVRRPPAVFISRTWLDEWTM